MLTITGDYCPQCGARLEWTTVDGRERRYCPTCESVVWRNAKPIVGVAVVDREAETVLLARRGIEPHRGTWCVPGGHIEHDEDPARGAARELREETGVRVDPDRLGRPHAYVVTYEDRSLLVLRYVVDRAATAGEPDALEETTAVRDGTPASFAATDAGLSPTDEAFVLELFE